MEHEVIRAYIYFPSSKQNIFRLLGNLYFEVTRHDECFPLIVEVDKFIALHYRLHRFTTSLTRKDTSESLELDPCYLRIVEKDGARAFFKIYQKRMPKYAPDFPIPADIEYKK